MFLKRKIKAAFEREPIDKNKGFFNVPFLPMPSMFSALPSNQPGSSNIPTHHGNRPGNPHNLSHSYNPSITPKTMGNPNINNIPQINPKNDQTVVINLNKPREDSNININSNIQPNKIPSNLNTNNTADNIPKNNSSNSNQTSNSIIQTVSKSNFVPQTNQHNSTLNLQNKTINPSTKHLFNVNQSNPSLNVDVSKPQHQQANISSSNYQLTSNSFNIKLSEEKEIKYQINASNLNNNITHANNNNPNDSNPESNVADNPPSKMSINLNNIQPGQGLSLLNLSPEEFKKLKPEQIDQINKAIRQKAQMQHQQQQQNINNVNNINNTNNMPSYNKLNQMNNPLNSNSNANFKELIRQQQSSIYMHIIDSFKNDPEKFKSDATTSELIKLQKLISMSTKMHSENQMNSNNHSNHFVVSNIIPKEGINNSYQLNLQLLQSIQKQIQRREIHQNPSNYQNANLVNHSPNEIGNSKNNMKIQISSSNEMSQQNNTNIDIISKDKDIQKNP